MGSLVGDWLCSQPNTCVTLLGRSGRAANSALLRSLCLSANPVALLRCDVSCREEVAAAFGDGLPRGVIHAGGVLADGVIPSQSASSMRTVFAPKVGFANGHWSRLYNLCLCPTGTPALTCAAVRTNG